ncbi:hypothetical protein L596_027552 [Steinernema carpocapsae]|uniref:Gamma-glutamyltransferase n=1 Tax=Steinernema carpocapsae TaxID=34508 RepID=A0A4U5LVU5_STECR|nr:hypothetical protein L596_027552 [Steinernema carpocapsae]
MSSAAVVPVEAESSGVPESLPAKGRAKGCCRARFLINLGFGLILTMAVFLSLLLFVFLPHINGHTLPPSKPSAARNYDWTPPSYSLMGKFKKAAVTCDHGLCSEMGRDVLIKGGNAIDAAVASMFCLGITNPQSSGIGGGFILTLYNKTTQSCTVIDARETAPEKSDVNMFVGNVNGSKYGYRAIATPGEIAGYWLAFNDYGSGKVAWEDLIMPSVHLARNGVPVSEYLGDVLKVKEKHFRELSSMQSWIDPKTNEVYKFGDIIKRPELAHTLEKLAKAKDPAELFYRGEMADEIVEEIQHFGGILTKDDMAKYKPRVHKTPLINDHFSGNLAMCGPPPPSSFTVTQLLVSLMGRYYGNKTTDKESLKTDPLFYHRFLEASKFSYAQRTLLGDADFVPEAKELAELLTKKEYSDSVFERMMDVAQPSQYYGGIKQAQSEDHGTSHVSAIDAEGNGVSSTTTVNRWFGAVVQSEKLGIVWNDEMDDFSSPNMTNGFGFAPSETNFIAPGKRPMSSMSPMVVFDRQTGNLKMVMGASGGSKIISALAKPLVRVLFFNETIKEAIDAPTLHNQFTPDITQFEASVPKELMADLEEKYGQKFKKTTGFEGIMQGIVVGDDGLIYANGDFRRKTNMHAEGF